MQRQLTDGPVPVVFIVEDELPVRRMLHVVVESGGLEAKSFAAAEEFVAAHSAQDFGCLLLDLRLGGMSGIQLLEWLRQGSSLLPVVMMTGHGDLRVAVECMKLGAVDFLEKPVDHRVLHHTIQAALLVAAARRAGDSQSAAAARRLSRLTARERQLMELLVEGASSKAIAARTGLSVRTVSNHRAHLLVKTGAQNTAELVRLAMLARSHSLVSE